MYKLLILFMFFNGCIDENRALIALTPVRTTMTPYKCIYRTEAGLIADIAVSVYVYKLYVDGIIYNYRKFVNNFNVSVCVIKEPYKCSGTGYTVGPFKNGVAARKAGCASDAVLWASEYWPPICNEDWPDEPGCTNDENKIIHGVWVDALLHEVYNLIVLNIRNNWPGYDDDIYQIESEVRPYIVDIINKCGIIF